MAGDPAGEIIGLNNGNRPVHLFEEPKIDCHNHVLDPARFPYGADNPYHPAGQEIGTAAQLLRVMDSHGVRHSLVVAPNSGYGTDLRCLLDAIEYAEGRLKGIAVVPFDISVPALRALKAKGVVGVAFNPTFDGLARYAGGRELVAKLADLDLFLQVQVEHDQMLALLPVIAAAPVRLLIDHCGRPTPEAGLDQPGFQAILALAATGRASVKLSGLMKFSREPYPYADTWPFVRALVDAFGLDACVWGSDWPFLRAPQRLDYGPLLSLVETLFPDPAERQKLFWDTPRRLFGFGAG